VSGAGGTVYSGFVFDQSAGTNRHVGQRSDGSAFTRSIRDPQLARSGRHVVFLSDQGFLTPGDTNTLNDALVQDLETWALTLASARDPSDESLDGLTSEPRINADGRWVARTDPSAAASRLTVSSVTWAAGTPRVEWSGRAGVRYQLERSPDLTSPGGWVPTGDAVQGAEGPLRAVLSEPADSGLHRLRVLP
jgi:hypothetical protein